MIVMIIMIMTAIREQFVIIFYFFSNKLFHSSISYNILAILPPFCGHLSSFPFSLGVTAMSE